MRGTCAGWRKWSPWKKGDRTSFAAAATPLRYSQGSHMANSHQTPIHGTHQTFARQRAFASHSPCGSQQPLAAVWRPPLIVATWLFAVAGDNSRFGLGRRLSRGFTGDSFRERADIVELRRIGAKLEATLFGNEQTHQ